MIAALPMYDFPVTAPANDRFWALIREAARDEGLDAPQGLTRDIDDLWQVWLSPDLLMAQTCGYPYRARLHGRVALIGTPDYGLADCPAGYYQSIFVARADDPRDGLAAFEGATFAYNEPLSQSGWAAPQTHVANCGIRIGARLQTGAHRASAIAVAEGRADLAALDAVTWRLLNQHDGCCATLRVLAKTVPTPGLPLIGAITRDPAPMASAIRQAIAGMTAADRETLGIRDLIAIPAEDYLGIATPPAP